MSELYTALLALLVALWGLWLEYKLRRVESERDAVLRLLHGVVHGTYSVEIINGRVKVHTRGVSP
jgi:hypothetical protein